MRLEVVKALTRCQCFLHWQIARCPRSRDSSSEFVSCLLAKEQESFYRLPKGPLTMVQLLYNSG
jgi:hypothetical protein